VKAYLTRAAIVGLTLLLLAGSGSNIASIQAQEDQGPRTGPNNAITDVPGIKVGQYEDMDALTGTTVIRAEGDGAVGGVDVRGSAPGTRETDLMDPINLVENVNAVVLSGGSAYGLAAADGVMRCLQEQGIGFPVGPERVVPIVPAAILFDLGRGGDDKVRPTAEYGYEACTSAESGPVAQGVVGAGTGALSGGLKGGVGTASIQLGNGVVVGAIVAVNSSGSTIDPENGSFFARYLEIEDEFGLTSSESKASPYNVSATGNVNDVGKNTTIGVVATNATLTKAQAKKIAQMAHDGLARAIQPAHTMFDGDTIFALATGNVGLGEITGPESTFGGSADTAVNVLGDAAASTFARAVVHAIVNAESVAGYTAYCDEYPDRCAAE